jgi:formylmethanofuran dehydrogenase subunit C
MGALGDGGAISGLTVQNGKIYVSGTTSSSSLNATTAGGTSASGGTDAFLFTALDQGTSVDTAKLTYLGTSSTDKGAALTVGSDGTVYVAGTTGGTFSGNSTIQKNTTNMFVSSVATDGSVNWVRQYGGKDGQSIGSGVAFSATGSSVLDALGLPSGQVQGKQDNSLTNNTTLRAGDFFKVEIEGDAGRTFKVTIDKGETLSSLCTKLNGQLGNKGKASVAYGSGGASLKIEASAGSTLKLIAGTNDTIVPGNAAKGVAATTVTGSTQFDALGRLGLAEQTLSKPAANQSASDTAASAASSTTSKTYAVGLPNNLDISTSTGAGSARAQLLNVLSAVQKIYQTTNTPASSAASTATTTSNQTMSAAMSTYNNNLNANASLALSILSA